MTNALGRGRFFRQFHRSLEFRRFFFDAEILRMEIVDLGQLVWSQRRAFGRFREFDQLFFVVNIRQRRSHTIIGQQPKQRRLAQRAFRIFEETEFIDLLDSVEQPTSRTMAPVIGGRTTPSFRR